MGLWMGWMAALGAAWAGPVTGGMMRGGIEINLWEHETRDGDDVIFESLNRRGLGDSGACLRLGGTLWPWVELGVSLSLLSASQDVKGEDNLFGPLLTTNPLEELHVAGAPYLAAHVPVMDQAELFGELRFQASGVDYGEDRSWRLAYGGGGGARWFLAEGASVELGLRREIGGFGMESGEGNSFAATQVWSGLSFWTGGRS